MRLGWATPFNKSAAIGRFSRFVIEELCARGHQVDVVRIESDGALALEPLAIDVPVRIHTEVDPASYDVLIVNFGNHAPYHSGALDLAVKRAPLGIFHDIEMRHFGSGLEQQRSLVLPILPGLDSDPPLQDPDNLVDGPARPILAGLAALTCGSVLHGEHYRGLITEYCPGPVKVMPLAYPPPMGRPHLPHPDGGRRVTFFGMIHEQKQPQRILQALHLLKEDWGNVEVHVAGTIEPFFEKEIASEARRLGLSRPIVHGFVSDEQLQDILGRSQVVCCLRYPVSEGSSASLITALYAGRPLIVPDVASFASVPDDLVLKVSYGHDWRDVAASIAKIFANPEQAAARADRAREWAIGRYSASRYVDALEPMLEAIRWYEPMVVEARRRGATLWKSARDLEERVVLTHARQLDQMLKVPA